MNLLKQAEFVRCQIINKTPTTMRSKFSQYLTPFSVAKFAASMFSLHNKNINCLDLGTGTGILSVAVAERFTDINIHAYELDQRLAIVCNETLNNLNVRHTITIADVVTINFTPEYDIAILNPPYKKMSATDPRQNLLPIKAPNLYAAFMIRAIEAVKPNGEIVAIIPRSWTNGPYFTAFRKWMIQKISIDWVHIYESRNEIFNDTDVLQETILIKITKNKQNPIIRITESKTKNSDITESQYQALELICQNNFVFNIKPQTTQGLKTINSIGLCASTGKIVNFRVVEFTKLTKLPNCVKLVYPCNFQTGKFLHPIPTNKPQWIDCTVPKVQRQLIPPGYYVVVKRFTAKEERKRICAFVLVATQQIALENHLNYIHSGTSKKTIPLDVCVANGLSLWLNTSWVDNWFRARSGNTQVNASDLNDLPAPNMSVLQKLGKQWRANMSQHEIDKICEHLYE